MFAAIENPSSMAVDKDVVFDKQQASLYPNEGCNWTLPPTNTGTPDPSSVSSLVHPGRKAPIQKETSDEDTGHFVLLHDTKGRQVLKTKEWHQTLLQNGNVKDGRRYHYLSKSEPIIHRGISYRKLTDLNNNSNSLSRSLKHEVPRIVVTNPHEKSDCDGVVLRNPVSKFMSRHYGHSSHQSGNPYAFSTYGTTSHYHSLPEEFDRTNNHELLSHSRSYDYCSTPVDGDTRNESRGLQDLQETSNSPKRFSLPIDQLSTLDMIVRKNGSGIKMDYRSRSSDELDTVKRADENEFTAYWPRQEVPKKKTKSVGNCFKSRTTSSSSDSPRNRNSQSKLPDDCLETENNSAVTEKPSRRSHNMLKTEQNGHNGHSLLRRTCPADILRKPTEFQREPINRPISSSVKLSPYNTDNSVTIRTDRANNYVRNATSLVIPHKRAPSPANITGSPCSESRKSYQTVASPSSKRAQSPCQRTIQKVSHTLEKSRSEPDLESVFKKGKTGGSSTSLKNLFLPSSPSAMQKAKSSPSNKILSKRWRNKYKGSSSNSTTSIWRPEGYCTWSSVGGRKVVLQATNILNFSKASEQTALQQVALSKVQDIIQGCSVVIPKTCSDVKRHKKTMMKKRSQSVNLGGLLEHLTQKDRDKADKDDPQPMGLVFGIPLTRCITNDNELRKRRQQNSAANADQHQKHNQSSSSHGSTENLPRQNGNPSHSGNTANNRSFHAGSSDSLSESDASSRHTEGSTNLIDALSLSMSGRDSLQNENLELFNSEGPMVPQIVTTCFKHIENYGLQVLGIFRVGSSKKRVKQLRDEFDSGKDVVLDETQNPHDVGALLKEYFRDLPEPLLTRDLYSPFVATRRIHCPDKRALAVKLLVSLLPIPIRDTLWALVKFLKKVAEHSMDSIGENGEVLPGNKMDSTNLATLFGPNILHKAKSSGEREYLVESTARAEERKEVIEVVKEMIDNNTSMFEISAEMHDQVLRQILEDDPEACDRHLKLLASDFGVDSDLDASYSSVFDDPNYRQSPNHYASASDILQSTRASSGGSRPTLRQTASTSSTTHFATSDSERDDTDPRQGLSDYHDRQARRILRQRGKQVTAPIPTISSPTTGCLRVPGIRFPQRSLSSDKDNRTLQTTTLTIPQQSQYVRQNSCPGLSSLRPSSPPPVSPVVPFSRPLGSTCSRQNTPEYKGSRTERELSQTGRTRQLTRSRDASPMDRLRISPSSSTTTITISGVPPSGATSSQHGQPSSPAPETGAISSQQGQPSGPAQKGPNLNRTAAWQRERWRQWEILTTENTDDTHEQETLV